VAIIVERAGNATGQMRPGNYTLTFLF